MRMMDIWKRMYALTDTFFFLYIKVKYSWTQFHKTCYQQYLPQIYDKSAHSQSNARISVAINNY